MAKTDKEHREQLRQKNLSDPNYVKAEQYKASLPKTANGLGVLWTIEAFSTWVNLAYPDVHVAPGQTWAGVMPKYKFICNDHGEYEARATSVLEPARGSQCPGCKADQKSQLKRDLALAHIGETTGDGKLITGVKWTSQGNGFGIKKQRGMATYVCPVCGNEHAHAWLGEVLKPNKIKGCQLCTSHPTDTRSTFTQRPDHAMAPCLFYGNQVKLPIGMKLGITKDLKARKTKSYGDYFLVFMLYRALAWAIEQVIDHRLTCLGYKLDFEGIEEFEGAELKYRNEVFYKVDDSVLVAWVRDLIDEAEVIGWEGLLDRYIPVSSNDPQVPEMSSQHRLYVEDGVLKESTGEGYIGHNTKSPFDLEALMAKVASRGSSEPS